MDESKHDNVPSSEKPIDLFPSIVKKLEEGLKAKYGKEYSPRILEQDLSRMFEYLKKSNQIRMAFGAGQGQGEKDLMNSIDRYLHSVQSPFCKQVDSLKTPESTSLEARLQSLHFPGGLSIRSGFREPSPASSPPPTPANK